MRKKSASDINNSFNNSIRLIGTLTEDQIQDNLIQGRHTNTVAFNFLMKMYPGLKASYVLDIIPDQGFETITYVVDVGDVVSIEIDLIKSEVEEVEVYDLKDYIKGLSRHKLIKVKMVSELIRSV